MSKKIKLKSTKDKASYSIGLTTAVYLQRDMDIGSIKDDIVMDNFFAGIKDGLENNDPQISRKEIEEALASFRENIENKQQKAQQVNIKAGQDFLEENAKKEGITVTESGMQYEIISEGEGNKSPDIDEPVSVHYRGTLINGNEFDSSYSRGEPTTFKPNQVIKGWTEALMMMTEGSEWRVYLPANLAYGEHGAPPSIGPNEVLIFDIKLEKIVGQQ